jgi:hypothetical protein
MKVILSLAVRYPFVFHFFIDEEKISWIAIKKRIIIHKVRNQCLTCLSISKNNYPRIRVLMNNIGTYDSLMMCYASDTPKCGDQYLGLL